MNAVDWNAAATLIERDDGGSELHYNFRELRKGQLGDLVREVAAMPAPERARVVIDIAGGETINVGQIMDLAARADLA
jgi:hypothetical protein